jgi:hypothetical protein
MPKLPPNFVKAPAKSKKKKAVADMAVSAEPVAAPAERAERVERVGTPARLSLAEPLEPSGLREVLVRLTDEQYRALQSACDELRLQGQRVTVDEMVQRVVAGWMTNTANLRNPAGETDDDGVVAHLIRFAQSPV